MCTQISFTQADRILAKSRQMPFLEELKEEMDNELHLVILGAAIGENAAYDDSGENPILAEILAQCKPIFPDSRQRFDIIFEDYIIYRFEMSHTVLFLRRKGEWEPICWNAKNPVF